LQKKLEGIEFADDVWLLTKKRTPCAEEITKTKWEKQGRNTNKLTRISKTQNKLTRIGKAQEAFNQLGGMWRTNVVSADAKIKMFNC
jgi:hypothetical protein